MEARKEEPETINVWELMSGIDDGGEASPRPMTFPAIPVQKHMPVPPDLASRLSLDSFSLEPETEIPKHQPQPLLHNVNQRHARSSVLSLEDPATHVQGSSITANPAGMPSSSGSTLFGSVSGSNSSSTFDSLADNVQRSLSFKLVFDKQNTGVLGPEDTLSANPSKDERLNSELPDLTSVHGSSEGDSLPESSSAPSSLFSASSKLMRWFNLNIGAVKTQNATRGGSNQDGKLKKPPTISNALPALSSIPSGNVTDMGTGKRVRRSSSQLSDSGSSCRGSDEFSQLSGQSLHKPANAEQNIATEGGGHGHPVRRYRHSFSSGNQSRGSAEDGIPTSMNRPSSWELEKVVADSGHKAVLYSTNLRTDINAYEDSNAVRAILISLVGAAFDEKCVSQNPEYEQELKFALNLPVVAVPTICVMGKYIAGIDNIMQFFKKGILGSLLLQTLPHGLKLKTTCICRGGKFLICPICKGKRRITRQGEDPVSCRHCVGTGLLKCPSCPK